MAKKLYYKIGEACKELDIQPYVLRYWETEFQALSPSKSKSGQRVYSAEDLELIGRIKELLYKEGYTIAGAKKKLDSESSAGPRAVEEPSSESVGSVEEELEPVPAASADGGDSGEEAAEQPPPKPAPKPKRVAKKAPRRAAASAKDKTVARLRQGIEDALREAKDILEILDRA